MKTVKIRLDKRYSDIINRCILDKQHLLNNLIILWNKENDEIRNDLLNPIKFKKKIMGKLSNNEYINGDIDVSHWDSILEFKSKYTYDGLNSVLREFAKNLKVNLKSGRFFKIKPKKLSSVNTGSYLIENNNMRYYNGKGGRKRLFSREIGVSLLNPKYSKEKGLSNNLKIYFNDEFMKDCEEIRTVTFVKKWNDHYAYIAYSEKEYTYTNNNKCFIAAIDPGSNNHITLVSNNPDSESLLVSYSSIKRLFRTECNVIDVLKEDYSDNKFYISGFYAKRHRVMENELNKISNRILNYCNKYNIGTLIIGKGFSAKSNVNMGRSNNRKFHSFPHYTLKLKLMERLSNHGINVVEQEESYTSKISCINPNINVWEYSHEKGVRPTTEQLKEISRSHQSVLRDKYNMVEFNADVNGAFNILMKYLKERVVPKHSQIFHPKKINNDFKFLMVLDL